MILAALILGLSFHAWAGESDSDAGWEKVTDDEGIHVYKREIPGSPVLAFKGDGTIDAPIGKVASIVFDTKRAPEWIESLEKSTLVRWISDHSFIEYDIVNTPPIIMKDRDFVSLVELQTDAKAKRMTFLYHSIQDSSLPVKDKYVRGDLMSTVFVLTSVENGTKTHLRGEIHCDPMGSVPKWLVNFFQKDWPVDTFRGLKKQIAKRDVQIDPRFAHLFE